MRYETQRLTVRPFLQSDEENMLCLLTDETVKKTYMLPDFSCREDAKPLFARMMAMSREADRYVAAICLGQSCIGILNETEREGTDIEVGYALLPAYFGCGYAAEALTGAIAFLFDQGFTRVLAGAFEENGASIRVMEKSGMKKLPRQEEIDYRGKRHLCVYYAIEKDIMEYQDINAKTIDRWIEEGWEWGVPITHEDYLAALEGKWDMLLTPTKPVPHRWFGDLKGKKVLGLASGGGQQMPIFAALGAQCTVLDYSMGQLQSEEMVAQREGYDIRIIRADMTKPLPFADGEFDLIFHPVSNCYVKQVKPIFRECFRVLRSGGVLLCGLGNEVNYLVNEDETVICNTMPFDPLKNEQQRKQLEEDDCGMQFSHTVEEQIGGQLEAGFLLTDIYGDTNGEGRLHEMHVETYLATRAVKP